MSILPAAPLYSMVRVFTFGILILLIALGANANTLPFPPNSPYSDSVTAHYPNALFLREQIFSGQLPVWRDTFMGGQPFWANPLNKVFYPPQYLALLLPPILHLNVLLWLHLIAAGVGAWSAARSLRISDPAAKVVGIAYVLTPRLLAAAGAGHLDVMYALAWLPWVIVAPQYASAHIGHSRLRRAVTLGVVMALSLHADLRISVFSFTLAALLVLINRSARLDYSVLIGAIPVVALLTAPLWIGLLQYGSLLSRAGLTPVEASVESLTPVQFVASLLPRPPGSHEQIVYVGLAVLVLGCLSIIHYRQSAPEQRRIVIALWLVILFCALYSLGSNGVLWSGLVRLFPPLLWLRVPPRIWIIAVFALLILAGYTLSSIRSRRLIVLIGLLIVAESLYTGVSRITFRDRSEWLDRYAPLAEAIRADGGRKFYSPTYSIPVQATAYFNLQDIGGVDPFQFTGYIKRFEQATGTQVQGYSITLPPFDTDPAVANRNAIPDLTALSALGVTHIVSAYPIDLPDLNIVKVIDGAYVYRIVNRVS